MHRTTVRSHVPNNGEINQGPFGTMDVSHLVIVSGSITKDKHIAPPAPDPEPSQRLIVGASERHGDNCAYDCVVVAESNRGTGESYHAVRV